MIEVRELTKRFGGRTAVDRLSFTVRPGRVTGFLGPNGAGKSTTLRVLLGLDAPTSGSATIGGRDHRSRTAPLREVGALLDARAVQDGRTAFHHLLWQARTGGAGPARVEEVLELVGLAAVAGRRVRTFSLGMAQRLGLAAALLGDPPVLLLDEPVNGLDTEGIRWLRGLLRDMAAQGRTILLSSHVMTEMELTADHLVVIARGRLLADAPIGEFLAGAPDVLVRSPDLARLAAALREQGAATEPQDARTVRVTGLTADRIGALAAARGLVLHELTPRRSSLEDVYTRLTAAGAEHTTGEAA